MNKLKFLIFLSLMALNAMAATPAIDEESKLIKKYCDDGKGNYAGKLQLENTIEPIACENGMNNRYLFEYLNLNCNISNQVALETKPYNNQGWTKILTASALSGAKKQFPDQNCQEITYEENKYFLNCDCETKSQDGQTSVLICKYHQDITDPMKVADQKLQEKYLEGLADYTSDEDGQVSLIEAVKKLNVKNDSGNKTIEKNDKTNTTNSSGINWESLSLGSKLVLFNNDIENKNKLLWSNPDVLGGIAPSIPTNPNPVTLYLIDESKNEPTVNNDVPIIVIQKKNSTEVKAPIVPEITEQKEPETVEKKPDPIIEEKKDDKSCSEELKKEIAKLLEDDKKNIIGLQYELTVLKMAAQVVSAQRVTLEGLAKTKAQELAKSDTMIIGKMNDLYTRYGVQEDGQKVSDHLKEKMKGASYYQKDKRFFNEDSSAFLMAYREINPTAGIKDSDISVLWFMDKVSEKSKIQNGQFSAAHNLTNLSTRIAQYTGAINANQAFSKTELDDMVKKQKSKIDDEFLSMLNNFKTSNLACYNEIFGDGENECNLNQVENSFSDLLAITAKLSSTDLVSFDKNLKGGVDKTRFNITKYVEK